LEVKPTEPLESLFNFCVKTISSGGKHERNKTNKAQESQDQELSPMKKKLATVTEQLAVMKETAATPPSDSHSALTSSMLEQFSESVSDVTVNDSSLDVNVINLTETWKVCRQSMVYSGETESDVPQEDLRSAELPCKNGLDNKVY